MTLISKEKSDYIGPTFVTLCGIDGSRTLASELMETAVESLAGFGRRAVRLVALARYIATRDR